MPKPKLYATSLLDIASGTSTLLKTQVESPPYTDKKENQIFLIYKEIENGAVAKSHMRKGFLIYEEMRKYLTIYVEAVSHMTLQLLHSEFSYI